jgi:hypothetical protein
VDRYSVRVIRLSDSSIRCGRCPTLNHSQGVADIRMSTIEVGRPPWQRRRRWWHANTMRDELHISDVFTLYDEALCRMRQYLRCQSVDRQPATPDIINCVVIRRCNFTEGRVCILKWYCMCSIRMRWCSVSVLACGAFNDLDRWAVTDYLARRKGWLYICITLHDATFVQVICITYSWALFWKDCEWWGDANKNSKTSNCSCCQ